MTKTWMIAIMVAMVGLGATVAQERSPYVGLETRELKALSPEDVGALERGEGWGLALSAELNGVPGPAHLLELAEEIPLDAEQLAAVRELYEEMRAEAIAEGGMFLELEAEIEARFRAGDMPREVLVDLLMQSAESRGRLRAIHLSRHLDTLALLTPEQIARYAELRGYGESDPCAMVPKGHDPEVWRRHNGCE